MTARVVTLPHLVVASLASAWPGWMISRGPVGTWQAYRSSPDGRSRRIIVERTPRELDAAIRRAEAEQQ
jgi:hypothetical protein